MERKIYHRDTETQRNDNYELLVYIFGSLCASVVKILFGPAPGLSGIDQKNVR